MLKERMFWRLKRLGDWLHGFKVPRWEDDPVVLGQGWLEGRCARCGEKNTEMEAVRAMSDSRLSALTIVLDEHRYASCLLRLVRDHYALAPELVKEINKHLVVESSVDRETAKRLATQLGVDTSQPSG